MNSLATTRGLFNEALDSAILRQQAVATANVERLRRVHPENSPAEILKTLDRVFLGAMVAFGVGSGAVSAASSGAGAKVKVSLTVADFAAFTEASVLYVLSVAEVHGIHSEDVERRRLLVLAVMLGERASSAAETAIGRIGPHWTKQIVNAIPMSAINKANAVLGPRFITKYGTKQGVIVLSQHLPYGISAALGGASNLVIGMGIIRTGRKKFGDAPAGWSEELPEVENQQSS